MFSNLLAIFLKDLIDFLESSYLRNNILAIIFTISLFFIKYIFMSGY